MFIKSVLSVYLSLSVAFQHGKKRKKKVWNFSFGSKRNTLASFFNGTNGRRLIAVLWASVPRCRLPRTI